MDSCGISAASLMPQIPKNHQMADTVYEHLVTLINDFEEKLPNDKQAGGRLVAFHDTVFSIDDIGYWNPNIIIFYGTLPDGSIVQLVQHTTQLNLLLVAVPRTDDTSKPRRKIGFSPDQEEALQSEPSAP